MSSVTTPTSTSDLLVCFGGDATPVTPNKMLHGGKAASLIEMTSLGLRVPPGFTLTTDAYKRYAAASDRFREIIWRDLRTAMEHLEHATVRYFGQGGDPLLVSVRSGAPVSMPGMMDTVLNLGLTVHNIESVAERQGSLFAWSSFLRLIAQMTALTHGDVLEKDKTLRKILNMQEKPDSAKEATHRCKEAVAILTTKNIPFPSDPWEQLWIAIQTVFQSWDNERAQVYRKLQKIPDDLGTACTVQAMIFGNRDDHSGTGVCFSRDPATGEPGLTGEYLRNAQGEDVVAGTVTPDPVATLREYDPDIYEELSNTVSSLEQKHSDMLDIEFTIESGILYFLQCRVAKRSAQGALRIGLKFLEEGTITEQTLLSRIHPDQITQLLRPGFDLVSKQSAGDPIATGLPAGPGATTGRICLDPSHAPEYDPWILVRNETSPDDVPAMVESAGVLTAHGGMSSHAALVARQLGIVCIAGCSTLKIDQNLGCIYIGSIKLDEGEWISLDGTTGEVFATKISTHKCLTDLDGQLSDVLAIADRSRRMSVRANADTEDQAMIARSFGAAGIGLARTEHMFFGEDRLPLMQRLILAHQDSVNRAEALDALEQLQTKDFKTLLRSMDSLPVTIRTLDPPLHEFLPKREDAMLVSDQLGIPVDEIVERIDSLGETNPMLGFRGCRIGLLCPRIPKMQIRALARATISLRSEGLDPRPEIMVPLVGSPEELRNTRMYIEEEMQSIDPNLEIPIGTMIEVPRACLVAKEIAKHADFLSFGTNDLTQLTLGISRDDAGSFLPKYIEQNIYTEDPFSSLDRSGVGSLMHLAVAGARAVKPDIKIGICGEQGGDPATIAFCEELKLDYVSCSPYRVPVARLAGAQAK